MAQLKILSVDQIRALDAHTIQHEPISSLDLMERASRIVFNWLSNKYKADTTFTVFCGQGNNGGDGLVIARLLHKHGYRTTCYLLSTSDNYSDDNRINQERLTLLKPFELIVSTDDLPEINTPVVIDALFGSGLNRPVEGLAAELIDHINKSEKEIIAIDIASGLFADKKSEGTAIIQPTFTLTFQLPKLAFLLPENERFTGDWKVLDISLSPAFIAEAKTNYYYTTSVSEYNKKAKKYAHKGNFGHGLLIAGSYGKMGAALLASRACMKSGVGLLTTHVPKCGYQIMQIGLPEAMASVDTHEELFSTVPKSLDDFTALGIGPGLGTDPQSVAAFETLLSNWKKPVVVDADGLNILSQHKELLKKLPINSILTPHPGEFKRLVGDWKDDFERLHLLKEFCQHHHLIMILKGAHTAVCHSDGNIFFNSTGNPGMATAGSGDVLTGILLSYLAQGLDPISAAKSAVFNHGVAGDEAQKNTKKGSFLAGDIINHID